MGRVNIKKDGGDLHLAYYLRGESINTRGDEGGRIKEGESENKGRARASEGEIKRNQRENKREGERERKARVV